MAGRYSSPWQALSLSRKQQILLPPGGGNMQHRSEQPQSPQHMFSSGCSDMDYTRSFTLARHQLYNTPSKYELSPHAHPLTQSTTQSITCSLNSLTQTLNLSSTHSLTRSLTHCHTHCHTHSLTHCTAVPAQPGVQYSTLLDDRQPADWAPAGCCICFWTQLVDEPAAS
jgi:hypothetical protein